MAGLFTLGLLAAAVAAILHSGPALAASLRLVGTPGKLAVSHCVTVGSGKQAHTECFGAYTSDDGSTQGLPASIGAHLTAGSTVPVQRTDDGSLAEVGVVPSAGWLSVLFLGLVAAGLGGLCTIPLLHRSSSVDHYGVLRLGTLERRLFSFCAIGCAVALGAALLSALTSVVARLVQ